MQDPWAFENAMGFDIPRDDLVDLLAYGDSDNEAFEQYIGASVVSDTEDQDLPDIDTAMPSDDDEEVEPLVDEDKEIFGDTEFAILALGEDPEHKEIESIREPADDEYEEDEDENGIVVIKKRNELKANPELEEKLPVLDPRVADNLTGSFATIMLRYYLDADVKHTTRDKDIPKKGIVNCSTHEDIDTSASFAFVLGDQNDSLEEVAERLVHEKTIQDGKENWILFGGVYRHPGTNDVEVRAMPEDQLGKLAKALDISNEEVLEKLAEQAGRYRR